MVHRIILGDLVDISQTDGNTDYPFEGLRILARIIAANIITTGATEERPKKPSTTTREDSSTCSTKSNINKKTSGKYPVTTREKTGNKQYTKNPVTFTIKTGCQEQANTSGKRHGKPQA